MGRVKDVLDDFASLHEGGAIALVKDRVRPHTKDLTDEIYKEAIAEHLGGDRRVVIRRYTKLVEFITLHGLD